jgi:putative transposase
MKAFKSYRFRLLPSEAQTAVLLQHGGNLRYAWNKLVEFSNAVNKETKVFPTKKELRAKLKDIQKENDFLKISHSQPLQNTSDNLFDTIVKSFKLEVVKKRKAKIALANSEPDETRKKKKLAQALNFGFPKFKRKDQNNDSIFYPQAFKVKQSRIYFPKIGWINYKKHRRLEGKVKFLTIVQDGNEWFVSMTSEVEVKEQAFKPLDQANIVGIDVGLKVFATLSNGTEIQNPRTLKKHLKRLRKEQRVLSRRQIVETGEVRFGKKVKKSSSNRNKQILKVQRTYKKVKNARKDFLHKTSHQIIAKFDGIALETLDIQAMMRGNGVAMNRNIADVSWFEFGRMLEYKCLWNHKHFIKIDQFDPSTQKCNQCHSIQKLSLKDRTYVCPQCGNICGRDINAAKNIRDGGFEILNKQNTLASKEIYACGVLPRRTMKQEKLGLHLPSIEGKCLESQAPSFRWG